MKTNVYAIYDKKAETYSQPFLALNNSVACRMVQASMDPVSLLTQFPHDYRLDKVAVYDDTFAKFLQVRGKVIIAEVSNLTPLSFDDGVVEDVGEGKTV